MKEEIFFLHSQIQQTIMKKLPLLIASFGILNTTAFAQNPVPASPDKPTTTTHTSAAVLSDLNVLGYDALAKMPILGVKSRPLTNEESNEKGIRKNSGFLIQEVDAGGSAAILGLKIGDIVTKIDGRALKNTTQSLDLHLGATYFQDDEVEVSWLRGTEEKSGSIKLENAMTYEELSVSAQAQMMENLNQSGGLQAAIEEAIKSSGLSNLGNGAQVMTMQMQGTQTMSLPGGKTIVIDENQNLIVTDKKGNELFKKENFDPDADNTDIPAEYQMGVRMLSQLSNLNLDSSNVDVEETTKDLLKRMEKDDSE